MPFVEGERKEIFSQLTMIIARKIGYAVLMPCKDRVFVTDAGQT
jgi:hypothetical protein